MVEQLKITNLEYKRVGESFADQVSLYIDKKYKPSSCEYQVIKNHENSTLCSYFGFCFFSGCIL